MSLTHCWKVIKVQLLKESDSSCDFALCGEETYSDEIDKTDISYKRR